jgi:hypothetical protein
MKVQTAAGVDPKAGLYRQAVRHLYTGAASRPSFAAGLRPSLTGLAAALLK